MGIGICFCVWVRVHDEQHVEWTELFINYCYCPITRAFFCLLLKLIHRWYITTASWTHRVYCDVASEQGIALPFPWRPISMSHDPPHLIVIIICYNKNTNNFRWRCHPYGYQRAASTQSRPGHSRLSRSARAKMMIFLNLWFQMIFCITEMLINGVLL